MTLAHLSDTHLGFRAYGRVRPDGANVREVDVLETFQQTPGRHRGARPRPCGPRGRPVPRRAALEPLARRRLSRDRGVPAPEERQAVRDPRRQPRRAPRGRRAASSQLLQRHPRRPRRRAGDRRRSTSASCASSASRASPCAQGCPFWSRPTTPAVLTLHGMSRQALPRGRDGGDFDAEPCGTRSGPTSRWATTTSSSHTGRTSATPARPTSPRPTCGRRRKHAERVGLVRREDRVRARRDPARARPAAHRRARPRPRGGGETKMQPRTRRAGPIGPSCGRGSSTPRPA